MHHKGYQPSDRAQLAAAHPATHQKLRALRYPDRASLLPYCAPVMDQGSGPFGTNSCVPHAASCGIVAANGFAVAMRAAKPIGIVPSPKGIYDELRAVDRVMGPDGRLSDMTDDGSDPLTLTVVLPKAGVRAMRNPTSDGRFSDCEPASINAPETLAEDEEALKVCVAGEHAIDPREGDFLPMVAASIASGRPVLVGIEATDDFERWAPNMAAPLASGASFTRADHGVLVVAYYVVRGGAITLDDGTVIRVGLPDGTILPLIRNSWSEAWGASGNILVTGDWLQRACAEAIVFDVTIAEAA